MKDGIRILAACALQLTAVLAQPAGFPQDKSDLKPDPMLHFGSLPNGLRYVIMHNPEPKGRASFRLLVDVGSLYETEQQRGLAHFLEHMAFNGSRHFPSASLVETLQRMGMDFGHDTNASTTFDHTQYALELPDVKPETLDTALTIFQDYAANLDLPPTMVEKERGIVLSERLSRDSVGARMTQNLWDYLYGGTLYASRTPIGLPEVIKSLTAEQVRGFYDAWYRPERMTIVAVGDFDVARVEGIIRDKFAGLGARAPGREEPVIGELKPFKGTKVFYDYNAEASDTGVAIMLLAPSSRKDDTMANRMRYLPRDVAISMISKRLALLAQQEIPPFLDASASVGEMGGFVREMTIGATAKPDQWQGALTAIDRELRRAFEWGFTASELREVVTNMIHGLEEGVNNAATRHSTGLANSIAGSVQSGTVFTTAQAALDAMKPTLEKLTPEQCAAAFREAWQGEGRYVVVRGNAKIDGDAQAVIAQVYEKAAATALAQNRSDAHKDQDVSWAYTNFGTPGKVVERRQVADMDMTLVTFANGVRLNFKKTGYDANQIGILAQVGTGEASVPVGQPGLAGFVGMTFGMGGLAKYSVDDIRSLLAGRSVKVGFGVAAEAFVFNGGTNRSDLLLTLQLMTAMMVDPGYRPEALWLARRGIEQSFEAQEHSLDKPFAREVSLLLVNHDPRFVPPTKEMLMSYTLEDVKAWLSPELARGPIEMAIVGDLDIEATISAVARTLGALPARAAPAVKEEPRLSFPDKPFRKEYSVATKDAQGVVAVYWPTTDGMEIKRSRRLSMLGAVLSDRLRVDIRERLGGTYTPSAGSKASTLFRNYGYMGANATVDPKNAARMVEAIVAAANDLSRRGVSSDELARVKNPVLADIRRGERTNGYWMSLAARAQTRPEVLDEARSALADIESIGTKELDALARAYLADERASSVIVRPSSTAAPAELSSASAP